MYSIVGQLARYSTLPGPGRDQQAQQDNRRQGQDNANPGQRQTNRGYHIPSCSSPLPPLHIDSTAEMVVSHYRYARSASGEVHIGDRYTAYISPSRIACRIQRENVCPPPLSFYPVAVEVTIIHAHLSTTMAFGFNYRNVAMLREVTPRLFLVYMFMSVSIRGGNIVPRDEMKVFYRHDKERKKRLKAHPSPSPSPHSLTLVSLDRRHQLWLRQWLVGHPHRPPPVHQPLRRA